jgi:hypothetical protein
VTYDSWKTRSPDDDLGCEPISKEQEKAGWEDEMQQRGIYTPTSALSSPVL